MDAAGTPPGTVEVRVYRHGEQIHRELCESVEEAQAFIEDWPDEEQGDVDFELDDLSVRHRGGQVLDPTPEGPPDDERSGGTG